MKLVTVSQMQSIEKEADASGLTYDQMMENAGRGLADIILDMYAEDVEPEVVGLVGPGNNGGDTLVALSVLVSNGWKARAYLVKRKKDDLVKRFGARHCGCPFGWRSWYWDQAAFEERDCGTFIRSQ